MLMDKLINSKPLKKRKKFPRRTSKIVTKMTASHLRICKKHAGRVSSRAGSNNHHRQEETCCIATHRGGGELLPWQ